MKAVRAPDELWNRRIPTSQLNRWLEELSPAPLPRNIGAAHQAALTSPSHRAARRRSSPSARAPVNCPISYMKYLTNSPPSGVRLAWVPIRFNLKKG